MRRSVYILCIKLTDGATLTTQKKQFYNSDQGRRVCNKEDFNTSHLGKCPNWGWHVPYHEITFDLGSMIGPD